MRSLRPHLIIHGRRRCSSTTCNAETRIAVFAGRYDDTDGLFQDPNLVMVYENIRTMDAASLKAIQECAPGYRRARHAFANHCDACGSPIHDNPFPTDDGYYCADWDNATDLDHVFRDEDLTHDGTPHQEDTLPVEFKASLPHT